MSICAEICWLKSKKEWVEDLNVNEVCSQDVQSLTAEFDGLTVNTQCAQNLSSQNIFSDSLMSNSACLGTATINSLCVTNLNAPNFTVCNTRRAYLGFSSNFLYTLGQNINFNVILDDPSGMASLTPTTQFTGSGCRILHR